MQRAHYTARRAKIREALTPSAPTEWQEDEGEGDSVGGNEIPTNEDLRSDGRKKGPQHHKAFAAETSALTGESKRNINQYRAIGDALGEDALRVTGTSQRVRRLRVTLQKFCRAGTAGVMIHFRIMAQICSIRPGVRQTDVSRTLRTTCPDWCLGRVAGQNGLRTVCRTNHKN